MPNVSDIIILLRKNHIDISKLIALKYELLKNESSLGMDKFKALIKQSKISFKEPRNDEAFIKFVRKYKMEKVDMLIHKMAYGYVTSIKKDRF